MNGRARLLLAVTLLCVIGAGYVAEHLHKPTRELYSGDPDNEKQRDNVSDREIARTIRREIVRDKALSTYAHNIEIHVKDGRVTLLGLVRSETEANSLKAKAVAAAGEKSVINQLDVVN